MLRWAHGELRRNRLATSHLTTSLLPSRVLDAAPSAQLSGSVALDRVAEDLLRDRPEPSRNWAGGPRHREGPGLVEVEGAHGAHPGVRRKAMRCGATRRRPSSTNRRRPFGHHGGRHGQAARRLGVSRWRRSAGSEPPMTARGSNLWTSPLLAIGIGHCQRRFIQMSRVDRPKRIVFECRREHLAPPSPSGTRVVLHRHSQWSRPSMSSNNSDDGDCGMSGCVRGTFRRATPYSNRESSITNGPVGSSIRRFHRLPKSRWAQLRKLLGRYTRGAQGGCITSRRRWNEQ
jgi:hypothetical protein